MKPIKVFSSVSRTFTVLTGLKHFSIRTSCSDDSCIQKFANWSKLWFKGVEEIVPVFLVDSKCIEVLSSPTEFYNVLLDQSATARSRISLASLYLGNGEKEETLVNTILLNLATNRTFPVNVLLEHTRGSRGSRNSRTLLLPLKRNFSDTTTISLFHTPHLRGLLKAIVPARFNETINVTHIKAYIFDDTLILTGANLSEDYFTNRQDRYVVFKNSNQLCDYFDALIKTIGKFSLSLQAGDTTTFVGDPPSHPYDGTKRQFKMRATSLMSDFMDSYKSADLPELIANLPNRNPAVDTSVRSTDTLVFPLLQMRDFNVRCDEHVTENLLATAPSDATVTLATAYFNLTDEYWRALLSSSTSDINLIMAHPKSMGFYKSPGLAGCIPNAYSLFAYRRYQNLTLHKQTHRIKFYEFQRPQWTFHGKGLWVHFTTNQSSPMLTLIGSPNFGKRSVYRDMEAQVGIVTVNERLRNAFIREKDRMLACCTRVNLETFQAEERMERVFFSKFAEKISKLF